MKAFALFSTTWAVVLVTLAASRSAQALGPVDLEGSLKVGYGSNDLGFGIGGRAGVALFGFYAGPSVVYYVGADSSGVDQGPQLLAYGGELGFGFKIWRLTIRPLVGFGDASVSQCGAIATNHFYVEPGGVLQLKFGFL